MPLRLAFAAVAGAAFMTVQPIADEDVLEPSVENEVVHALGAAPTNAAPCAVGREEAVKLLAGTNRLSATELAIKLVSSQRADGRWFAGTNDVTAAAIELLENLR